MKINAKRTFVGGAYVFLLAACAHTTATGGSPNELTEGGKRVQLMKSDPPPGCVELKSITGDASGAGAAIGERSRVATRNMAANLGANYVRMETVDRYGIITGTAYKCPEPAASMVPPVGSSVQTPQ